MKNLLPLLCMLLAFSFFAGCGDDNEVTNTPPVIADQTFSAAEDISDSDLIGTVVATDNENDELTFSITQNSNDLFSVTPAGSLSLAPGESLDFETDPSHTITVEVTDGENANSATITINVTDVDENTAPVIDDQTFTAAEDIDDATIIGNIVATDADGDALTYEFEIPNVFDGLFEISASGELSLASGKSLDFETTESYQFGVTVSDGSESVTSQIRVDVTDVEDSKAFISTWRTPIPNMEVVIPVSTNGGFTYDYTIDWGDGTTESNITGNASHTYVTADTYTIEITGDFPAIELIDNTISSEQIYTIEQWGDIEWQSMYGAFANTSSLIINASDAPDLSQVTDMSFMFINSGVNQSLNNWDVSNVTNMESMFSVSRFDEDISGWNVSSVTNMSGMFNGSEFNQSINMWNVSNVTNMLNMFRNSPFNQDIGSWVVSSVTNMTYLFSETSFNQDITSWDVSSVTTMQGMFSNTQFDQDISSWDVSNVTDMRFMFRGPSAFNQDISGWNVDNVTACSDFANNNATLDEANTPNFTKCSPNAS